MASILITGGAGFIGSNLAESLCGEHDVVVLDDFSSGKKANLPKSGGIKVIKGDICDRKTMRTALSGVQYVLHHAALASVPLSFEDPGKANRINVWGTLNLLVESARSEVDRVVYASSAAVYGDSEQLPKNEGMAPDPISPYAVTKLSGEHYCSMFTRCFGLKAVSLRYFNVFGPRQSPRSEYAAVVPRFMEWMLAGERPTIFGDGRQTRDFAYVKDIVGANSLAMESARAPGEAFNIASGKQHSLNDLVKMLNELLGKEIRPIYEKQRKGDIRHSLADIGKAKKVLGYSPDWSMEEGLEETLKWYSKGK